MNTKQLKKQIYKGNKFNFAILIIASLFETAMLLIISIMLEKVMAIAAADNINELYIQGGIFLALMATLILMYLLVMYIKPKYKKKAMLQYKNNIYEHILNKNITSFNKFETSTYISALTNDVNYIEENYIFSIFTLITQITLFISTIVVMIIYSPILTLSAIGLSLLPLVVALLVGSRLSQQEKKISDNNAGFMHFIKDNLIGFSTIKVFKAEGKLRDLFKRKNNELENSKAKKQRTLVLMDLLQTATSLFAQFGVFFIGAYLCIKHKTLTPSIIILFVQLMNHILSPLMNVPSIISKRMACKPLFNKIADIIKVDEINEEKKQIVFNSSIKINDLDFAYDDKKILKNINLELLKNKSYAIVGASGSGKTTLVNLLLGRSLDYKGEILYDDIELNDISIDSLYQITSFVEQNVFVFDDTIINNITMYSNVDDTLLNYAIKQSGLEALISEKGNDYKCGENGINLSGGEKQRISIARALIKKSQILLMDEATSALDNEISSAIINNTLDISNTTKIMITHKLDEAILKRFDEIIVLKNGVIAECGSFDELMNNNSVFKSLYEVDK